MKVIVVYHSRGGTTKKMAQIIAQRLKEKQVDVDLLVAA